MAVINLAGRELVRAVAIGDGALVLEGGLELLFGHRRTGNRVRRPRCSPESPPAERRSHEQNPQATLPSHHFLRRRIWIVGACTVFSLSMTGRAAGGK